MKRIHALLLTIAWTIPMGMWVLGIATTHGCAHCDAGFSSGIASAAVPTATLTLVGRIRTSSDGRKLSDGKMVVADARDVIISALEPNPMHLVTEVVGASEPNPDDEGYYATYERVVSDGRDKQADRILNSLSEAGYIVVAHVPHSAPCCVTRPLSAFPESNCWCYECDEKRKSNLFGFPSRMYLCPDCGNKRCPRATFHEYACTGSNEPGQEGSRY